MHSQSHSVLKPVDTVKQSTAALMFKRFIKWRSSVVLDI